MLILLLLLTGIALSAFFSGSETGFYRVTRVRLVTDAKAGNFVAQALLWLVGRSGLVVATVLIGNNIANYLVSLALLLAGRAWLEGWSDLQTVLPVLMTPVLFIYGELLPKYLFYQMPYRLLKRAAPLMLLCAFLFTPLSCIVLALEAVWRRLFGGTAYKPVSSLERQELQRVLVEGQEAGVVLPIQREIAQNMFTYGVRPVRQFAVSLRGIPTVDETATPQQVIRQAERMRQTVVAVTRKQDRQIVGCCLISDLIVAPEQAELPLLPVTRVPASESNIQVLTRLQSSHIPMAEVVDAAGKRIGVVTQTRLMRLLLADS